MAEGIGIPLRQNDNGLLRARGIFVSRRRKPARVHEIVFRMRRALRRGKAQKLRPVYLAILGLALQLRSLGQRLGAHIGREELWIAFFDAKIRRPLVAEKTCRCDG